MKALKYLTHPTVLIISFLLILISGEHFGGFYLLYILLALPHGGIHGILATLGLIILIYSNYKYKRQFSFLIEPILNITGAILLILSLALFFNNDIEHYNYGTFFQIIPIITLALFGLLSVGFLVNNVLNMRLRHSPL